MSGLAEKGALELQDFDEIDINRNAHSELQRKRVHMNDADKGLVREEDSGPNWFVLKVTACAALNSVLLGYDIGVMGGAILFIREEMHLDNVHTEIILGSLNAIAIAGAALSGSVSDYFGRTKTLFLASFLFLIGNFIMAVSHDFTSLLIGRLLTGVGVGSGLAIDPLYISEMSPPVYRGRLVSASETCINIGIMLGFTSSYAFSYMPETVGWRYMLMCGCIIPVIMIFLSCCYMPETPRWLIKVNRTREAEEILQKLCNSPEQVEETRRDIMESVKLVEASWSELFFNTSPAIKRMLLVVVGIASFQQLSGVESIMYYNNQMLEEAGLTSKGDQLMVTMLMGFFKTAVIVFAAYMLDHGSGGRRTMLLYSTTGVTFALVMVAMGHFFSSAPTAICGTFTYVFFFSLGLGPITWLLASETFPLHVRAVGMSTATMANRGISSIVAFTFLSVSEGVTTGGAFIIFATFGAASILFTYKYVPETQHKSLEEMLAYYEKITGCEPSDIALDDNVTSGGEEVQDLR